MGRSGPSCGYGNIVNHWWPLNHDTCMGIKIHMYCDANDAGAVHYQVFIAANTSAYQVLQSLLPSQWNSEYHPLLVMGSCWTRGHRSLPISQPCMYIQHLWE